VQGTNRSACHWGQLGRTELGKVNPRLTYEKGQRNGWYVNPHAGLRRDHQTLQSEPVRWPGLTHSARQLTACGICCASRWAAMRAATFTSPTRP
jgi:hypothetical protein